MNRVFEAQTVDEIREILLELNERFKFAFSPRGKRNSSVNNESEEEGDDIEDTNSKGTEVLPDDESSKSRTTDQGSKITPGQNFENTPSSKLKQPAGDDMEIEAKYEKIKKIPCKNFFQKCSNFIHLVRFWGMFGDKLKTNWINFTTNIDNVAALYFSTLIFCDMLNKYVDRMTVKYFSIYNSGKEYMNAKWRNKKEVKETTPIIEEKRTLRNRTTTYRDYDYEYDESPEQVKPSRRNDREMNIDYLESFKHNKKVVSKGTKVVRDANVGGKSTAESNTYSGRLRSRTPSEERTFPSTRGQDKKSKLDQLVNTRRSNRLTKNYREEESEEEAEYQDISEQVS